MNVAKRDLCIKLKDLSQWSETEFCWNGDHLTPAYWPENMRSRDLNSIPAYDLGLLVNKIPAYCCIEVDKKCSATYSNRKTGQNYTAVADTPEDAACKLAITLFKKGVLKRGSDTE